MRRHPTYSKMHNIQLYIQVESIFISRSETKAGFSSLSLSLLALVNKLVLNHLTSLNIVRSFDIFEQCKDLSTITTTAHV